MWFVFIVCGIVLLYMFWLARRPLKRFFKIGNEYTTLLELQAEEDLIKRTEAISSKLEALGDKPTPSELMALRRKKRNQLK